jgi:phosphoribosylformylglycinamidine synthase I
MTKMHFGIILFPGTNCERDCLHVVQNVMGHTGRIVWHEETNLSEFDALILPGGFAHGDYLRTGAVARFSPIMQDVQRFAANGGHVLGICNGFQILCEAGMLPGALVRNKSLQFRCELVHLKTATRNSPFTAKIPENLFMRVPIAHGEGCYFADEKTLGELKAKDQILWQYSDATGALTEEANPNGSLWNIAGILNEKRNVAGLMPHPEDACEPLLGSTDGRAIFESLIHSLANRANFQAA